MIAGVVLGAVVGMTAAWLPARRALRMDVAAELYNRELRAEAAPALAVARGLLFFGLAIVGLDLCWLAQRHGALHPWQTRLIAPGILLTTIGFIVAGGAFGPILARLGQRLTHRRAGPVRLALANTVREPGRTGVMVIAVGAALGTAFVTASFNLSINASIVRGTSAFSAGRVRVTTVPPDNSINLDSRPSPAVVAALARLPGVASVDRTAALLTGHVESQLVGVEGDDHLNLAAVPLLEGSRDPTAFAKGAAMIGPALARSGGLHAGSLLRLDTPHGYAEVPVLGVWQYGDFAGRSATIPMSLLERLYGQHPPGDLAVRPAPGVSAAELAGRINAARLDPDLVARTPAQVAAVVSVDIRRQLLPFWAIQRGLLLVAFIAVVSTLLLVGVQRRRELGLLAAVGMRPSELARMVLTEAGVIGLIGVALGVVMSVGIYLAMYFVVPILIGFKDPFRLDFGSVAVYGPISLAMVLAAAIWPAWRTAHVEVLPALQYE
jgi:putative ABC transport system permease protein